MTLLRVPGSAARLPGWFGQDEQLPRVYGAGPWLAAEGRFFPGWGRQVELAALPGVAVEEAEASGGWCKVIADWSVGEGAQRRYGPSVPPAVLAEVVRQVHAAGGRVAVHANTPRGARLRWRPGRIPWSTGCTWRPSFLDTMARQGTALVPTLLAFAGTPQQLAEHPGPEPMRSWKASGWARHPGLVRAAHEAGVTVLAGTDSLGGPDAPHGRVAQEIGWLARAGVPAEAAWVAGPGSPGVGLGCRGLRRARRQTW